MIDHGRAAGSEHAAHLGAWAPDDTDLPHFGWHQYVARYIEGSGISWTHLAPHMFMQNLLVQGSLWKAYTDASAEPRDGSGSRAIHSPIGNGRVGWIAAEDIARVAEAALHDPSRHAGRKYNLSVDIKTVPEVVAILGKTLESKFHAAMHAPEDFHAALIAGGMEPT